LGESRLGPWTAENDVLWYKEFLPQDIKNARILAYEFDKKAVLANHDGPPLVTHAEDLCAKLHGLREKTKTVGKNCLLLS
jgi:hypothetical protein